MLHPKCTKGLEDELNEFLRLLNSLTTKESLGLTKSKIVHFLHNLREVREFSPCYYSTSLFC